MADKKNESDKKPKRRLRAAPVSMREQNQRAQLQADSGNRSRAGKVAGAPFRAIGRLFSPLKKLNRFRPFRIIGYIIAPPYVRNSWRELKLVTWPTGKQSRQLTFAVVVFSLVFGVIVFVVDYGLDKLFKATILS